MLAQMEQTRAMRGGQARLRVPGVGAAPGASLEIAIAEPTAAGQRYFDPLRAGEPWSPAVSWLQLPATAEANELVLDLDATVTPHLLPHRPYLLLLRGGTGIVEVRFVGIALRGATRAEPTAAPPVSPPVEVAAPVPSPAPTTADPAPPPRPTPAARPWVFGVLVLLAAMAAGGVWYWLQRPPPDAPVVAAAPTAPAAAVGGPPVAPLVAPPAAPPITIEEARRLLGASPGPDASLARARVHQEKGELDGAFLLYRHAAAAGNAEAALSLAAMYDPATHGPRISPLPAPNPAEAVRWYELAAQAGNAEAQYRLGMLLKGPAAGEAAAPEKGAFWLQRAAAQGHAPAAAELVK